MAYTLFFLMINIPTILVNYERDYFEKNNYNKNYIIANPAKIAVNTTRTNVKYRRKRVNIETSLAKERLATVFVYSLNMATSLRICFNFAITSFKDLLRRA